MARRAPKETLQAGIGLPVTIENDANAAAWAEFRFGAGRGAHHMMMLTIGTGVGKAVVLDEQLHRGGFGIAAELGHLRFIRGGLRCGCGQNGCLEQYASGRALQREANDIADTDRIGQALAACRTESGFISGAAVSQLVLAGDPGAIEALRRVATALDEACASLQAVLDPELFVIGGGVAQLGGDLLQPVRAAYENALRRSANEWSTLRFARSSRRRFIGVRHRENRPPESTTDLWFSAETEGFELRMCSCTRVRRGACALNQRALRSGRTTFSKTRSRSVSYPGMSAGRIPWKDLSHGTSKYPRRASGARCPNGLRVRLENPSERR